ncbi:DUF6492 family protein [Cohnella fermenti]|uniref:Glycosyltransferase family 2 protein n=1 Tax=Cohnella fermenti TaxID=2565925 RepID=A0A4S4C8I8_9BACL|nr:DUF6492 family protein [Cohnella fermenti]THF84277.1 hypothetical protein E6C55_02410 [Cohnella fermenti]
MPSGKAIDVLIPAIEKDLATLPHVIDSIRKHVRHPIGRIHLVSPDSRPLKSLAKAKGCAFVDERSLVSLKKSDIRYGTKQWERSGWLYQQLLKLSGDTVGKEAYVLVADADTVLIRPHRFLKGRRPIFYTRTWSQPEYYRTYRKLLGREPTSPVSFVTHYMLFHKRTLAGLKKAIEKKHGTKWYEAILKCMDRKQPFAFSEFETYGNYVYSVAPGSCLLRSAKNKHVHRAFGTLTGAELRTYSRKYRSLSFHQRREYSKRG